MVACVHLESAETQIGALDPLIAGHAVCLDATLITDSVREFGRIPRLRIKNWR